MTDEKYEVLREQRDRLRARVAALEEALTILGCICTCDRPAAMTADGRGAYAPGPHTETCVRTRARAALANLEKTK